MSRYRNNERDRFFMEPPTSFLFVDIAGSCLTMLFSWQRFQRGLLELNFRGPELVECTYGEVVVVAGSSAAGMTGSRAQ